MKPAILAMSLFALLLLPLFASAEIAQIVQRGWFYADDDVVEFNEKCIHPSCHLQIGEYRANNVRGETVKGNLVAAIRAAIPNSEEVTEVRLKLAPSSALSDSTDYDEDVQSIGIATMDESAWEDISLSDFVSQSGSVSDQSPLYQWHESMADGLDITALKDRLVDEGLVLFSISPLGEGKTANYKRFRAIIEVRREGGGVASADGATIEGDGQRETVTVTGITTSLRPESAANNRFSITLHDRVRGNRGWEFGTKVGDMVGTSFTIVYPPLEYNPRLQILAVAIDTIGTTAARLRQQTLTFTFSDGSSVDAYLPGLYIPASRNLRLYLDLQTGLAYFQDPGFKEPNYNGNGQRLSAEEILREYANHDRYLARSVLEIEDIDSDNAIGNSHNLQFYVINKNNYQDEGHIGSLTKGSQYNRVSGQDNIIENSFEILAVGVNTLAQGAAGAGHMIIGEQTLTIRFNDGSVVSAYVPRVNVPVGANRFRLYIDLLTGDSYYQDAGKDGTGIKYTATDIAENAALLVQLLARRANTQAATHDRILTIEALDSAAYNGNTHAFGFTIHPNTAAVSGVPVGRIAKNQPDHAFILSQPGTTIFDSLIQTLAVAINVGSNEEVNIGSQRIKITIERANGAQEEHIAYIPAIQLESISGTRQIRLYIGTGGSTYYHKDLLTGELYSPEAIFRSLSIMDGQIARRSPSHEDTEAVKARLCEDALSSETAIVTPLRVSTRNSGEVDVCISFYSETRTACGIAEDYEGVDADPRLYIVESGRNSKSLVKVDASAPSNYEVSIKCLAASVDVDEYTPLMHPTVDDPAAVEMATATIEVS